MPVLVDKFCGVLSEQFITSIREKAWVLDDSKHAPRGSHDLMMNNLTVNAFAGRDASGQPIYRYYLGIVLALFDAAETLVSRPEFCPEVPYDPKQCFEERPVSSISFVSYDYLRSTKPTRIKRFLPHRYCRDKTRTALAQVIFEAGALFIGLHEQAHFIRGHLQYIKTNFGIEKLDELTAGSSRNTLEPSLLRVLEFDADMFAAGIAFSDMLKFRNIHDAKLVPTEAVQTSQDYVRIFMVALSSVFGVLSRSDKYYNPLKSTHPTAAARVFSILAIFHGMCRRSDLAETFDNAFFERTIREVNLVMGILEGPRLDPQITLECIRTSKLFLGDPIAREVAESQSQGSALRPYLERFASNTLLGAEPRSSERSFWSKVWSGLKKIGGWAPKV